MCDLVGPLFEILRMSEGPFSHDAGHITSYRSIFFNIGSSFITWYKTQMSKIFILTIQIHQAKNTEKKQI